MKIRFNVATVIALATSGCSDVTTGQPNEMSREKVRVVESAFREGVEVEFLYTQDIEGVYGTTWLAREEAREELWRDIYIETSEKFTFNGLISFQCFADDSNGDPTIGIVSYGLNEFGDDASREVETISLLERESWVESGHYATPPYEVFVLAHYRFCGDEWEAISN